ncbi:lysoplasmalogenase family protein [Leptospira sp. 96542]|nr:lysoplasmalogenase family protein [Leptospira sp. 96542]
MIQLTLLLPVAVVLAFFIHWVTISNFRDPEVRMNHSRGTYLGLSFQLVLYSIVLWKLTPNQFLFPALAMLFSFFGDYFNLQFPSTKKKIKHPILGGIISFAIAQIFFIYTILAKNSWGTYFNSALSYAILILFLVIPAVIFFFRVYNPAQPKIIMFSALIYGFILCCFVAIVTNAFLQFGGYYIYLLIGGLFFLLSDAVMGETTINGGRHPSWEYQVPWVTYLIAQGFLLYGFFAIAHTSH